MSPVPILPRPRGAACVLGGWRVGARAAGGDPAGAAAAAGVVLAFFPPCPRFLVVFLQQRRGHDILPGARQHPQRPVRRLRVRHRHGGSQRGDPHQGEVPQDVPRQRRYLAPGCQESRDTFLGCPFPPYSAGFPSTGNPRLGSSLWGRPEHPQPSTRSLRVVVTGCLGTGAARGTCRLQAAQPFAPAAGLPVRPRVSRCLLTRSLPGACV